MTTSSEIWALAAPLLMTAGYGGMRILMAVVTQLRDGVFARVSMNAVRRLEEFAPRMNDVLKEARRRGATIIHSPSDCMPAYADHPARKRVESLLAPARA